ncbi:MAG: DUF4446 family protein [Anaerolineae bacterium]|nr:DUF4446 family protein [Anaerolineae bacterium]
MESILLPWIVAATIMVFVAAYWIYTLEKRFKTLEDRYQRILALAEESDEVTIGQLLTRLDDCGARIGQIEATLKRFNNLLPHTIQGYGTVRYQAFPNVGGDQSFSLALVDGRGNGVMLTGLHGRDVTRVYAKPLVQWRTSYSLSAEEQQSLGQARQIVEGAG